VDTPVVVFDGSESIIPTNDTIVSWTWTITDPTDPTWTLPGGGNDLVGEKALVPQSAFTTGDSYSAVLTVISAVGLAGTATLQYTQS
jgi:hypothetical protein